MPTTKDQRLNIMASEEEVSMLAALADAADLTMSHIVRALIKREYQAKFGDKKPKAKR